jgi:hypothetical protein
MVGLGLRSAFGPAHDGVVDDRDEAVGLGGLQQRLLARGALGIRVFPDGESGHCSLLCSNGRDVSGRRSSSGLVRYSSTASEC